MLLKLVGKNMDLTESLKAQAEKKFSKLDNYFNEEIEGRVVFSTQKNNMTVEVTIFLPGTILRAEETTQDMYASIDKALDSLERQVRKYKTRLKKRYQDNSRTIRFENVVSEEPEVETGKIIRRKKFNLRPMNEEEAALQMELLNHNFFIFLNAENDEVEVLYKRRDGNYGLIEVDAE
ncbi:ribosome hibernation-promoting factor, HPF/YfiA family [Anaerosphaera multitolerans]|uniref:Ribosome hibernation promoting factor n=1 Tax=Anaerosphaera multitolerans TaxID=2487351 RepID=A0A437S9Y4_9FIRM|nr:ribosome-associated translation inhibitor RaiA [Anaerosphaera multitolerans]RVU55608.1 ribosome-associated translation inhibitor RaiA [Anaerosphaera multitolerans]